MSGKNMPATREATFLQELSFLMPFEEHESVLEFGSGVDLGLLGKTNDLLPGPLIVLKGETGSKGFVLGSPEVGRVSVEIRSLVDVGASSG